MAERKESFTNLTNANGPITLRIGSAGEAFCPVTVITDPGAAHPELTFTGSQSDLDKVRFDPSSGGGLMSLFLGLRVPRRCLVRRRVPLFRV